MTASWLATPFAKLANTLAPASKVASAPSVTPAFRSVLPLATNETLEVSLVVSTVASVLSITNTEVPLFWALISTTVSPVNNASGLITNAAGAPAGAITQWSALFTVEVISVVAPVTVRLPVIVVSPEIATEPDIDTLIGLVPSGSKLK